MSNPTATLDGDELVVEFPDRENMRITARGAEAPFTGRTDIRWLKYDGEKLIRGDQYLNGRRGRGAEYDNDYAVDFLPKEKWDATPRKWDGQALTTGVVDDIITDYPGEVLWKADDSPDIRSGD